jgi:hypothetical protein
MELAIGRRLVFVAYHAQLDIGTGDKLDEPLLGGVTSWYSSTMRCFRLALRSRGRDRVGVRFSLRAPTYQGEGGVAPL